MKRYCMLQKSAIKQEFTKKDFPIFTQIPNLVYLDSAATSLKPQSVIDSENEYYTEYSANINRGIYKISEKATELYEKSRSKIAQFVKVKDAREIVFVRSATEAINLVMYCWGRKYINADSGIVTTIMEHHSNFVPWQTLCRHKNAKFTIIDITEEGLLDEKQLIASISAKTKLVVMTHVSNVLGTVNPIKKLIAQIKLRNRHTLILVDGAQAVPHMPVDILDLGCDFYVFSSHKMLGPTGIGILWGKFNLLFDMDPFQYGGDMIEAVYPDYTTYKAPPHKFEAGTPHIAGVIGLGAAVDYLSRFKMSNIRAHEYEMCSYFIKKSKDIKNLSIIGSKNCSIRGGVIAFVMEKTHSHDIAQILDQSNICIRSGHHCAMPLHLRLKLNTTARASFHIYTTTQDIDRLIECLRKVNKMFL